MAATYKSVVTTRLMAEQLALRTGLATVVGVDASGNPTISVGTMAAGSQSAFIRVKQDYDPSLQLDGIGNTQRVYTPHVVQLVVETSTIANVPLLTGANYSMILLEALWPGTKVELYMTANTTAPSVSGISGANLKKTLDRLWHPMTETL